MKILFLGFFIFLWGCSQKTPIPDRYNKIPADAVKVTPENDKFPPVLHSSLWEDPVPLKGPVNTAGAEDSPFILPDGNTLFFFFTPDVDVPANEQLLDGVTGIWWTHRVGGEWQEPERIVLSDDVALDGAPFVLGDTLWFASIRSGNYGEVDIYRAVLKNGVWTDVWNAGSLLNQVYDVGELHITASGDTMYCGRPLEERDIWMLTSSDGSWSEPVLVSGVSDSGHSEDQPFITGDGNELWFTGQSRLGYPGPAIFRSVLTDSGWGEPEEIISNFSGEPTLDREGNIYFVHHFYSEDMKMIEADIYVCYRK